EIRTERIQCRSSEPKASNTSRDPYPSERDFVIQIARRSATTTTATPSEVIIGARLAEVRTTTTASVADLTALTALAARIQHLQFAAEFLQHDFRGVALDAVLFPFTGLQLAFDINLHTFLQVLLGD